jgi:tetratricopeptide (TPR) repeat protein
MCASAARSGAADIPSSTNVCDPVLSSPLSKLEQRLFAKIQDGRFEHFSLLEAGLIAGGVKREDDLQHYCRRFDLLAELLRGSGKVQGTPHAQARAIFDFLHRNLLQGGYSLQASDLRQAFDHGRFNCVTATLLMNCLARRFELEAVALQLPGHALSRLTLPHETLDIETTCLKWFDRDPNIKTEPGAQSRPINDVQLVATIYYNLGVDLLAEGRFADAAGANAKALRLDPNNATAKGNYLATINNWGIERAVAGDYPKAAELFHLGLATDSSYEAFHANYLRLYREWALHLCREGRDEAAVVLLDKAIQEQPGEKFLREAAIEIMRRLNARFDH